MIDHVTLNVADLERSRAFFAACLAPLGFERQLEHGEQVGFVSPDRYPEFWIARRDPVGAPVHVAFRAAGRAAVDAFHASALEAGGSDNGPPGIRLEYGESYYGGYVLDPDGNNVEAMTYSSE